MHIADASYKHTWDSEFPNFSPALSGEKLLKCLDCPWRSPSLIFTKSCQIHKLRNTSTQITSTVPTACKGSFTNLQACRNRMENNGKNGQIRDPRPSGLTRRFAPTIHSLHEQVFPFRSRRAMETNKCWHLGWAGFPRCKAFMDLVCKLSMADWCSKVLQWLYWARDSCASLHPCRSEPMAFRRSGWIHSNNKLVVEGQTAYCSCGMLRTGINRFATRTTSTTGGFPWVIRILSVSGRAPLCHSSMPDLLVTAVKPMHSDTNSIYTAQRSTTSEKPSIPLRHCTLVRDPYNGLLWSLSVGSTILYLQQIQ